MKFKGEPLIPFSWKRWWYVAPQATCTVEWMQGVKLEELAARKPNWEAGVNLPNFDLFGFSHRWRSARARHQREALDAHPLLH